MLRNSHGRYMFSHELMPLLGFRRGGHLPRNGFEARRVQGTLFRCLPAFLPSGQKSSRHRIQYFCSACAAWIPFGRASQHVKGRKHRHLEAKLSATIGEPPVHTFEMGERE